MSETTPDTTPVDTPETPPAAPVNKRKQGGFKQKGEEPLNRQIVFRVTISEYHEIMDEIAARRRKGKITATGSGHREYFMAARAFAKNPPLFQKF